MQVPIPFTTSESALAAAGAADAKAFAANAGRVFLGIYNNHATQDIYVRFGGGAAAVGVGVKVAAGTKLEYPGPTGLAVPADEVHVIGSGAGTTMYAFEGTGKRAA